MLYLGIDQHARQITISLPCSFVDARCRLFTATGLASRVGRVERFPRAHSLANYWGLTPGCRNSGENNQRLGSITKAGSGMARWLLAQVAQCTAERRATTSVV